MNPYTIINQTELQSVSDGMTRPLLENCGTASHILILVWPQLGDFDSLEYAWWLQREANKLPEEKLAIRAVGIGDRNSGTKFCQYTGFPPQNLFVEPNAELHHKLQLYSGLNLSLPGLSPSQKAWLNLMLMCAGLGSPGTLREVFRGYKGDRQAPQLIQDDEMIQGTPLPAFQGSFFIHILHLAPTNEIRGYTNKVRLRGLTQNQLFGTRAGGETSPVGGFPAPWELANPEGFCLCSRDFSRLVQDMCSD